MYRQITAVTFKCQCFKTPSKLAVPTAEKQSKANLNDITLHYNSIKRKIIHTENITGLKENTL